MRLVRFAFHGWFLWRSGLLPPEGSPPFLLGRSDMLSCRRAENSLPSSRLFHFGYARSSATRAAIA
jgi:hypothetical protein